MGFDFESLNMPVENKSFDLLPKGHYHAVITDIKDVLYEDKEYVNIEFTIETPGYEGRKIWEKLYHGSNISSKQNYRTNVRMCKLKEFARVSNLETFEPLLGLPLVLLVEINTYTNRSGETVSRNQITDYFPTAPAGHVAKKSAIQPIIQPRELPAPGRSPFPPKPVQQRAYGNDDQVPF